MSSRSRELLRKLGELSAELKHGVEQAEAYVSELNVALAQLQTLKLGQGLVILGQVIHQEAYLPEQRRDDSALLYRAVLLTPEGLGVVAWDLEEYVELQRSPHPEADVRLNFLPFAQCSQAIQGRLLPQIQPLVAALWQRVTTA